MDLLQLSSKQGARHKRKRVGRGNASGHGTYSCKGMKGQKARSGGNRRPGFEGGQTPFVQRMPKLKGFSNPGYIEYQIINVNDLEVFANNAVVNKETLVKKGIIKKAGSPVKLLGNGELSKALKVEVDCASAGAIEKVKNAKGSIEVTKPKKDESTKATKETKAKKSKKDDAAEITEAVTEEKVSEENTEK